MSERMAAMSRAEEQDVVGNTLRPNSAWNQAWTALVMGPSPLVLGLCKTCAISSASRPTQRGWLKLMFVCIPLFL